MWASRDEAYVTLDGAVVADVLERLDRAIERLLHAGAIHMIIDLHRLTGDDRAVLELLAAACRQLWARRGTMSIHGLRDRLISRPEVSAFPEVFGNVS
jgi:anti-anti-sigma regulatory factor